MGGQLIKGYSIQGDVLCSTGVVQSWKLYKAQNSSTHASATIFLVEKKHLKKQDKDQILRMSKKQSTNLVRVRHPGVLAVIESVVEDQNVLAFVSEKVEGNIALLLKQNKMKEFVSSELELKLFLYPFVQTLQFIHSTLKQVHLGISLDSIFVTSDGKWKLAGFGMNQVVSSDQPIICQDKPLDLSCSAPEFAIQNQFTQKSDLFSLGVVILRILESVMTNYKPQLMKNQQQYERSMKDLKNISSHPIIAKSSNPSNLSQLLQGLLNWNQDQRISLPDVLRSSWMNDSTLITVKCLDKISNYESKQQLEFLKGLAGVLDDFPQRVLIRIVIPKLLDLLKYNHLIASIVYIIVDLIKRNKVQVAVFRKDIWPALKTVTQAKETTAQAIYLFVANIQLLETSIGEPDFSSHIMPLYLKCYDCPPKLKQLALSMIEKISKKVDYQYVKTKMLPKLLGLLKDPNIDIRKDALRALLAIVTLIDTQTVSLTVLPGLETARKSGSDPFINSIIAHMYKILGDTLQVDIVSSKILPTLIPYLTDQSLTKTEFVQWKSLIFRMIQRIQREAMKQIEGNGMTSSSQVFTEVDFKFKEIDMKSANMDKKGNYNFLSNYSKSQPQEKSISPTTFAGEQKQQMKVQTQNFIIAPRPAEQTGMSQPLSIPDNFFTSLNPVSSPQTTLSIGGNSLSQQISAPVVPPKVEITQKDDTFDQNSYMSNLPAFDFQPKNVSQPRIMNTITTEKQRSFDFGSFESSYVSPKTTQPITPMMEESKPKEKLFIGGASGPMQIKKLKGPTKKDSPTEKTLPFKKQVKPAPNEWNFDSKNNQKDLFSLNFEGSNTKTSQPLGPGNNSSSNNPFEDIETPVSFNMNMIKAPEKKQAGSQSADIYSYFESEDTNKEQSGGGAKASFDLI